MNAVYKKDYAFVYALPGKLVLMDENSYKRRKEENDCVCRFDRRWSAVALIFPEHVAII